MAVVVWEHEFSIQIEGFFDEPLGEDRERLCSYFASEFPNEARLRATRPSHVYFRVTPVWARYNDLTDDPPPVLTLDFVTQTEERATWPIVPGD